MWAQNKEYENSSISNEKVVLHFFLLREKVVLHWCDEIYKKRRIQGMRLQKDLPTHQKIIQAIIWKRGKVTFTPA